MYKKFPTLNLLIIVAFNLGGTNGRNGIINNKKHIYENVMTYTIVRRYILRFETHRNIHLFLLKWQNFYQIGSLAKCQFIRCM